VVFSKQRVGKQFAAYWAGWTGDAHKLTDFTSVGLSTLYLAFADYSGGEINTSVSGYITKVPAANS
jgi:hypothetical protein